jgi:hypothetical protein
MTIKVKQPEMNQDCPDRKDMEPIVLLLIVFVCLFDGI